MTKKLLLPIGLLVVGVVLLVISLSSSVSSVLQSETIEIIGERYNIRSEAKIVTKGIIPMKEAKLTFKVVDANNNVLAEKTVLVEKTEHAFSTTYTVNDFEGIPKKIIVEVSEAKFNNTFLIVLSIIIIIGSLVISYIFFKKRDSW